MRNGGEVPHLTLMYLLSCLKRLSAEALSQLLKLYDNPAYKLPVDIVPLLTREKLVRKKADGSDGFELSEYVAIVVASAVVRDNDRNTFAVRSTAPID
jgi:hypothetical protein